ncbi:hypothetical protein [Clostridium sp. OS1-26]|uniref:hypothetical protein n=1 Tax=Clostridium sp. OS1-26 TaxID=3070681 RepID=UPI0027E16665|nr:hypothetical protein [Clostridium sp. OS1-26]WML35364.1 hypothetical protein RCG18_00965 [Clostridium sp. OS1-26]
MYPTKVSIKDFLGGTEIRFESIHRPVYHSCRYKIDGRWRKARISFQTGRIKVNGQVVRRCLI